MTLIYLASFMGCWKEFEQLPQVDITKIPYENSFLDDTPAFVSILESNLICPDGQNAPIFVVYPQSEDPLPVAIVFHSNPVAFISAFEQSNAQLPDRLSSAWVENKLWETLGLSKNPQDLYEQNQGYLPTALTNGGFVQIYPGNCWGDYWHSDPDVYPNFEHIALMSQDDSDPQEESEPQEDTGVEDPSTSEAQAPFGAFTRYGRVMAQQTLQAISDPAFAEEFGLDFPQAINAQEQHWIGLGEGGRAILGLLELESVQSNLPKSVIFDSAPLNIQPYVDDSEAFPLEAGTISRVFVGEEGYPLSDLSLFSWNRVAYPDRVAILWSNGDSKMPREAIQGAIEGIDATDLWIEDQNTSGHIFLNRDFELAERAVQFMKTGDSTIAQPEDGSAPEDTGEEHTDDPAEDTAVE